MSRSSYTDDYGDDYPGQLDLYRANVERSIKSKKGQARLRELRDVLLAKEDKQLDADVFVSGESACALGEWWLAKVGGVAPISMDSDEDTADFLKPWWPRLVVRDLIYENDDDRGRWEGHCYVAETPEHRYERVLAWVTRHIVDAHV